MAIDPKTLGAIKVLGALVALWGVWQDGGGFTTGLNLAVTAIAIVILVTGAHHLSEKKGRR